MIASWYADWLISHCRAFGLDQKESAALASATVSWSEVYGPGELSAATAAMLRDRRGDPLLAKSEGHRVGVPQAVSVMRAEKHNKQSETRERDEWERQCVYCSNTGWAIVPHPGKAPDGRHYNRVLTVEPAFVNRLGEPVFRDLAVVCTCACGGRLEVALAKNERQTVNLLQYDTAYPNWQNVRDQIETIRRWVYQGESSPEAQYLADKVRSSSRKPQPQTQGART